MKSGISLLALAALAWTGAAVAKPVKQWTDATTGHAFFGVGQLEPTSRRPMASAS